MLQPHGVRKACRRLRETGGADPWCGPGLTTSVVLLSILEYYAYSISPGQARNRSKHCLKVALSAQTIYTIYRLFTLVKNNYPDSSSTVVQTEPYTAL